MLFIHAFVVLAGFARYTFCQSYIDSPPLIVQASPFLVASGSSEKWIGSDSTFVTKSTFPVTATGGTTTTTTTSLEYAVATATADTSNDKKGDISIVITPKLKTTLGDLAVKHCGGPVRKRDLGSCGLSYAADAVSDPGFLVNPPSLPTVTANDIAHVIQAGLAAGKLKEAQVGAATIALVSLAAWFASSESEGTREVPNALKIPSSVATSIASSTTTTSSKCTITSASTSPLCDDVDNCDGLKTKTCEKGTAKNCPCHPAATAIFDTAWQDLGLQASLMASIDAAPLPTISCFVNYEDPFFDGKPRNNPATWCVCDGSKGYATMTSTKSPCAYSSLPAKTISVTTFPDPPKPSSTSCRTTTGSVAPNTQSIPTGVYTYCTCNDQQQYPWTTSCSGGNFLCATGVFVTQTGSCSSSTPSATATAPTYSATPVCMKPGWTVTSDQVKAQQQKFCAQFGTNFHASSTDPQSCAVNLGGDAGQGNINDPPAGNAIAFTYGRDPDNQDCKNVDAKTITFTLKDCMAAIDSINKACPAGEGKSQGGRDGINCAMYQFNGGSGQTGGAPCNFDQQFPNGFIGPP